MRRLTITLTDEKHRALKQAAARSGKTIGQIVAESLEFYGIKTEQQASALVARARQRANLRGGAGTRYSGAGNQGAAVVRRRSKSL